MQDQFTEKDIKDLGGPPTGVGCGFQLLAVGCLLVVVAFIAYRYAETWASLPGLASVLGGLGGLIFLIFGLLFLSGLRLRKRRENLFRDLNNLADAGDVEALLTVINGSSDDIVRGKAVRELAEVRVVRAVNPLMAAAKSNDVDVRVASIRALGHIKDPRAFESLQDAVRDDDEKVRMAAVEVLDDWGDSRAFDSLLIALQDHEDGIRQSALYALKKIKDVRSVEPLVAALKDQNKSVRRAAASALGEIGDPRGIEPLVAALTVAAAENDKELLHSALKALCKIKDPHAFEQLARALNEENSDIQWSTTKALEEIGSEDAVDALVTALRTGGNIRSTAAIRLVDIGTPAVLPLIAAIGDRSEQVRWQVGTALGEIGDKRAVEPLLTLLEDSDAEARVAAIEALVKIGDARAVEPLSRALKDSESIVRKRAAEALGRFGVARSVEPLAEALEDKDLDVQQAAARALEQVSGAQAQKILAAHKESATLDDAIENPVAKVLQTIKALGPDSVCAYCQYAQGLEHIDPLQSHKRAQSAANHILDSDPEFLSLARSGKALIKVIDVADGSTLIFGGLLSVTHATRIYKSVVATNKPDHSELALPELPPELSKIDVERVIFVQEYRVNYEYVADFERAYAADGTFGGMFVRYGCKNYTLLKDKHKAQRYVVIHTWRDWTAFSNAQERAAQESYNFQQRSRGWVASVRELDPAEVVVGDGKLNNRYEVLSEF